MEEALACARILWDYLQLNQTPQKADCIIGLGCYNLDVPRRAAQLYRDGFAPWVLFTGALGRVTQEIWDGSEARRFAEVAMNEGVPEEAVLLEERATNSAENILFSRALLEERGIAVQRILAVHKPYMERRVAAAWPVYWPGVSLTVTSWQQSFDTYYAQDCALSGSRDKLIHMLAGDYQRIERYAQLGYQLPQPFRPEAQQAFETLVKLGYTNQLVKE